MAHAFWSTSTEVLRAPDRTFARALPDAPFESSYIFAILSQMVGILPTIAVQTMLPFLLPATASDPEGAREVGMVAFAVGMFVYVVMWALMGPIVCAALDHVALKLVGARPQGFDRTFRGWALAQGSMLLGLVPVCGAIITTFLTWAARVRAYRAFHGISTGRAFAATVVASALIALPVLLLVGVGVAAAMAASQTATP
ncbi:MAG: YIP1 family protein [Myxococcaceae bacterium]|nr:YIP1 family protein [Myxococcaceae bacterium]